MYRKFILGAALLLLLTSGLSAATVTIFTNESLWNIAVHARTNWSETEDFDHTLLEPWLAITSDAPESGWGPDHNWQFESRVRSWSEPFLKDTFTLSLLALAAGATWDLSTPGGQGEGINVYADIGGIDTLVGNIPRNHSGFWGFVVDGGMFTYIRAEGGHDPLGIQETYWMDDLSIGVIPEPSTYALVGAGLMLLAFRRRK